MISPIHPSPIRNPAADAPSDPSGGGGSGGAPHPPGAGSGDLQLPLSNLAAVGRKVESLRCFLSESIGRGVSLAPDQLHLVSSEIASAVHHVILNSAALLASSHPLLDRPLPPPPPPPSGPLLPAAQMVASGADPPLLPTAAATEAEDDGDAASDCDIVEIDAEELLTEHVHFCEICGKGFKRDANLRMHMRAHGDRFKTLEALSRPDRPPSSAAAAATGGVSKKVRFSCPFVGCNRNKAHRRFRPLKSAVCVKNHFKRSHCPKMYACQRCGKKSFAVLADLKSHLKHCGDSPWRCSCGTSFSRKDKLFGHLALFEGHAPAVASGDPEKAKQKEAGEDGRGAVEREEPGQNGEEGFDMEFFEGWMEEFNGTKGGNWPMR